jgi:hypothetical protein
MRSLEGFARLLPDYPSAIRGLFGRSAVRGDRERFLGGLREAGLLEGTRFASCRKCQSVALHDILQRRASLVAFGAKRTLSQNRLNGDHPSVDGRFA